MKRLYFIVILGFVISGIVFFSTTDSLHKLINKNWSPHSNLNMRYESILHSSAIISENSFADILISMTEVDLKRQVIPLIEKKLKQLTDVSLEGISELFVDTVDLSLLAQGIKSCLVIKFKIDALDLFVTTVLSGEVGIITKENGVLLKPLINHISINPVNPIKDRYLLITGLKEKLVSQAISILNDFLVFINDEIFKDGFHIPFKLTLADEFKPQNISCKGNISIKGDNIPINISLKRLAVYINESSFNILAFASEGAKHKDYPDKRIEIVTESDFQKAFQKFEFDVKKSLNKSFSKDYLPNNNVSLVLVRKHLLAEIINQSLNNIDITISAKDFIILPKPGSPSDSNKFSQDITLHDKQSLPSCKGLYEEFKGKLCDNPCSYDHITCDENCRQGSCKGPCRTRGCPSCQIIRSITNIFKGEFREIKDCSKRTACEAENVARRTACTTCKATKAAQKVACDARVKACKIDRETRRINCERKNKECKVKREAARLAHQAKNELRVAECKSKRAVLKLVDGLVKLGEIEGQYWVNKSTLNSNISGIYITNDLDEIRIKSNIRASLDARLRVWVNPEGLGHIACVFGFRKTLETHATFHDKNFIIKGALSYKYDENDSLVFIGKTEQIQLNAKLSPSPYSQLIQDPGFVLNCFFLNLAIPTVAGVQLLKEEGISDEFSTLFGRAKIEIREQEFPFTLRPINVGIGKNSLKLVPKLGEKSIKFLIKKK